MKLKTRNNMLPKAKKLFLSGDYHNSMRFFNDIYIDNPNNKEAKLGILLCDVALDNEEQGQKLFEYYQVIKAQKVPFPQDVIFNLVKLLDDNSNNFVSLVNNIETKEANELDGILYDDFKQLLENNDFKTMFEYSMLSTKIIFTKKSDFYEFLNLLIDNGLAEMSMQYIETLKNEIIYDAAIQKIIHKALNCINKNTKDM